MLVCSSEARIIAACISLNQQGQCHDLVCAWGFCHNTSISQHIWWCCNVLLSLHMQHPDVQDHFFAQVKKVQQGGIWVAQQSLRDMCL